MKKNERLAIGHLTEELFTLYLRRGNIEYHKTDNNIDVNDKIDFVVHINDNILTVDVKSKTENDTGNIVNMAYITRDGKPGTLQLSKADYFAIQAYYNNQARFYLIKKSILFDYLKNKPRECGEKKSQYYQVEMSWISKNWSYFINEHGDVGKSYYKKFL